MPTILENLEKQKQKNNSNQLINTIGQILPLTPLLFEQFTNQKLPIMTGTIAEIQSSIQQINLNLQTILNQQNQLIQIINNLENQASNQLTNLTQQFNSLRLTHTREKKEIQYNNNQQE